MQSLTTQFQLDMVRIANEALVRIPGLLLGIVIVAITRFVAAAVARSSSAVASRALRSASLRILLVKTSTTGVWTIGVLVAALIAFPSLRLGDIFATLGLTSVAIGFAFQDIFKNFLAGILLLLNESFAIGDQVVIGTYEGTVEHIDLRFTELATYQGERILVPNATVFTSAVQVRTAHASRRIDVPVGLAYGCDVERAIALMTETVRHIPGVEQAPEPRVDVIAFAESSIDFVARFWCDPHQNEVLLAQSRVLVALDRALEAAGIAISTPTRSIVIAPPPAAGPPVTVPQAK